MRFIKLGLLSFLIIFGIVTAMSLLIPSQVRISRAINVGAEKSEVFSMVKDTTNWRRWQDTVMLKQWTYINKEVVANTDSTFILQMQQRGRKPFLSGWQIYSYPGADSLTVQWYMDFKLSWYPWEKFSSLFYENSYGLMLEEGLTNLKNSLN